MTQDNNGLPEPIESGTLPYADLLNHELPSDYRMAAHYWLEFGFAPIPITPDTKATARRWEPWLDELSHDAIDRYWTEHPDHLVGFIVDEHFFVIDADSLEAMSALNSIEKACDLASNLTVRTSKGEHHYFKRAPDTFARMDSHSTEKHPERLDVRTGKGNGEGRSMVVLPPSPGKAIIINEAANADDLVEVHQNFIDAVAVHNGREPPRATGPKPVHAPSAAIEYPDTTRVRRILAFIPPDCGYQDWLSVLMGLHHSYGGSDEGLAIADEWSAKAGNYCGAEELEYKWHTFDGYAGTPITMGTLVKMALGHGASPADVRENVALEFQAQPPALPPNGSPVLHPIEQVAPLDVKTFPNLRGPADSPYAIATIANVKHLLKEYGIVTKYDVIAKRIGITMPGHSGTPDNFDNTTLAHITSLAILNGLQVGQLPHFVAAIADQNPVNPVADWINSRLWDGVDRLPALYATLTTREDFPTELKHTLMFRWLLSAVAAVFMPNGFRARGVLVLLGGQSMGKTSWIIQLVDDPLLREAVLKIDHHLDAGSKDSIVSAISHWIVEIGELDSSFKKDVARLKGFITSDKDKVRRPYDKRDSEYQRRTVFCATVNQNEFLVDDTGNTRWWTLPVVAIDYRHGIDMQQLWAQMAAVYHEGKDQWWLSPEEERQLEQYNQRHRAVSAIRDALVGKFHFDAPAEKWVKRTATQVLGEIGYRSPSNPQTRECGSVLRDLFGEPTISQGKTRWLVPPLSMLQTEE